MLNESGSDEEDQNEGQDMVYYLKEDQTQYSKPLGLNKAPKRDTDGLQLNPDDISDLNSNGSKTMGDPLFKSAISDIGEEPHNLGDESLFHETDAAGEAEFMDGPAGAAGMAGIAGTMAMTGGSDSPGKGRKGHKGGMENYDSDNPDFYNGGKGRKGSRKRKPKPKKLTNAQRNKINKMNAIYGQDTEALGLSPRENRSYHPKGKKKITKKLRNGNMSSLSPGNGKKGKRGDTADELRAKRFKQLNLDKPNKHGEGEYDALKRKLRKFRKRKDLSFWVDYDSPYAEYLPHRFREWAPETKSGLNLEQKQQNDTVNDKAMELSRIYSRGLAPIHEDNKDHNLSRIEKKRDFLSPDRPEYLRPKSNASMVLEDVGPISSEKKMSREMTSSRKKSPHRPPKQIDIYNNFMDPDGGSLVKDSNDALNDGKNDNFNLAPLYDYEGQNNNGEKLESAQDDEIDFRPVKFNQLFDQ
jgi:hypothetical protein